MDIKEREVFKLEVSGLDSFDLHEFTLSPFEWNEEEQKFYFKPTQLMWETWQAAKASVVPYESCSVKSHEIIINETKRELIDGYDIAKEDEYLLESLVYRGACIGKAQLSVPEGFVLVEKKNTEDWYLDEGEGLWMDEPDNWLCDLDLGEVQAVEHKEYLITESNTLYATKVWNDQRQSIDTWEFFKTEEEANKAAAYCKAKFNEDEAREPSND